MSDSGLSPSDAAQVLDFAGWCIHGGDISQVPECTSLPQVDPTLKTPWDACKSYEEGIEAVQDWIRQSPNFDPGQNKLLSSFEKRRLQ